MLEMFTLIFGFSILSVIVPCSNPNRRSRCTNLAEMPLSGSSQRGWRPIPDLEPQPGQRILISERPTY